MEKYPFGSNTKGTTPTDSDLEELGLELDVVMDIGRYSMTLGPSSGTGPGRKKRTVVQDSIDLGLALVSSPACTPVPAALSVPLPLRVSVEEGSRCGSWGGTSGDGGGLSVLGNNEKQKERIQGYYLGSSSSVSTGSPSSPFERHGREIDTATDPSSLDTPYYPHLDASAANPVAFPNPNARTLVRKRSSFFGWEFAWDQEALERADDTGKLRSSAGGGGGNPARWKSALDGNGTGPYPSNTVHPPSDYAHTSKKPLLIVDDGSESFMDLGEDQESFRPSPALSKPSSGDGDVTTTIVAAALTTPIRLKKMKPGHSDVAAAGTSPSAEFVHGSSNPNLDSDDDDLDEDVDLQKTPTVTSGTTTKPYSQSNRSSSSSSPNQQQERHEIASTSESRSSSINESCITTTTTLATTSTTNFRSKLLPSLTRRGLSLKRSFKMGSTVGRTLGPGLTLSSAGVGSGLALTSASASASTSEWPYAHKSIRRCESERFGFREDEKQGKEKREEKKRVENLDDGKKVEKVGEEAGDGEDEMRSRVDARLSSASYACAASAGATLAPTNGGSGGSGGFEYTMIPKSMPHSQPLLPTMNTNITTASTSVASSCPTITQQYQQDGYGHACPFVDGFRPLEVSNIRRGDDDGVVVATLEQGMDTIRNDDHDGLPSSLSPPLPSSFPPRTTAPFQSQSLPPTPTKSRSMVLSKPSTSSFKKRSAPPALPAPLESSEWTFCPHSMSTNNGVGAAAASMVELAHTRPHSITQSIVGPTSRPSSRPTTPRPSIRLSAMNIGTVRSAFAGVGAKVSARMSINSASMRGSVGVVAAAGNPVGSSLGMGMYDGDGDFMDLRDPFASPPPFKLANVFRGGDHTGNGDFWVSERAMSSLGGGVATGYDDDDDAEVGIMRSMSSVGKRRVNMNAWGRLPMPSTSALPGSEPGTSGSTCVASLVASRKKAHSHHGEGRKHREKRARNTTASDVVGSCVLGETNASSSLHGYTSAPLGSSAVYQAGEDADFDVEEALLSQRLLRRLDAVEWD